MSCFEEPTVRAKLQVRVFILKLVRVFVRVLDLRGVATLSRRRRVIASLSLWLLALTSAACGAVATDAPDDGSGAGIDTEQAFFFDSEAASVPALEGDDGVWTYTEIPNTQCRDGSPAGVAVNLHRPSKKVLIYLEGGGWCVDELTCSLNVTSASAYAALLGWALGVGGQFDRADPQNPIRDWNYVYVPYCTGDLHSGANPDGYVPNVGPQRFVGYLNMQEFLRRIVAAFPDASDVLLSGGSAGGIGALRTSILTQRAFPNVRVKVVSDSGPPVSKSVYAPCLQQRERAFFALDRTILADCGADCSDPDDAWLQFGIFVAKSFSDRPSGIIEAIEDALFRGFLGAGNDNCTATALDRSVAAAPFRADLLAFRERVSGYASFGTFYPNNDLHTWTSGIALPVFGDFHAGSAGGVRLVDWMAKLVDGQTPGNAGP